MIRLKFTYKYYDSYKKKWKREKVDILAKAAKIVDSGIIQRKDFYKEAQASLVVHLVDEEYTEIGAKVYDFKYIKHFKVEPLENTK